MSLLDRVFHSSKHVLTPPCSRDSYTKRQSDATVNDLFFSDIVPVADTDPMAAAQALYHVLCLSTKKLLKVRQKEPYGDVRLRLP